MRYDAKEWITRNLLTSLQLKMAHLLICKEIFEQVSSY